MSAPAWDATVAPADAIAAFKRKGLATSFRWRDLWEAEHAKAFTVAGVMSRDALEALREAVDAALADGLTLQEFKARARANLVRAGLAEYLTGTTVTHPDTGEERPVQLGDRRLRTVFDTNLRTSYAAGHWAHFEETKALRPYLRYVAVLDDRTRPQHRAWHGLILPVDHPFWDTHAPPNGFNCRCTLQSLSERDLARKGWRVSEPPPVTMSRWVDPATGASVPVPAGIDPGFGHNVGKAGSGSSAAQAYLRKATTTRAELGAEMMTPERRTAIVDREIEREYSALRQAVEQRTQESQSRTAYLGSIPPSALTALKAQSIEPASGTVLLRAKELAHLLFGKEGYLEQRLPAALIADLPSLVLEPEAIFLDTEDPALVYLRKGPGAGDLTKVVVRLDQKLKTKPAAARADRFPVNAVRTASVVSRRDSGFDAGGRYRLIWGAL